MSEEEKMRKRLEKYLDAIRRPANENIISFVETKLEDDIRTYANSDFAGICLETDWRYYDNLRSTMHSNQQLNAANEESGGLLSQALKYYIAFLRSSKYNPQPQALEPSAKKKAKKKPASQEVATPPISTLPQEAELTEGARRHVEGERSSRNAALRRRCIERWGYQCQCCGMDFEEAYGEIGRAFIEVHHLRPISTYDTEHTVDATRELVPLCSNCHSMIHHGKDGVMTLRELRQHYKGTTWPIRQRMDD